MTFPGIQHVAVTVSDLQRSTEWYSRLFGADPVLDEDEEGGTYHHTVWAIGGGNLFGIHLHTSPGDSTFDERSVGLDHVGFACASRTELEERAAHLEEIGVKHGGVVDRPYGSGVSFRDPDGIALEYFAPPS